MASPPARTEITDEHVATLSAADMSGYWWYAVRQGHVDAAIADLAPPLRYLDFGCGAGGVLASVRERFSPEKSHGLDGTQAAVDVAVERGLPATYADFRKRLELPFEPNVITCLDVLEHLEDPVLALRHLASDSSDGATLIVTVPAMPSLHSEWDDLCGHFRRYTKRTLVDHLTDGGWSPQRVRYAFAYCVPPAWWQRRVTKTVQEVEFPPVSPLVNRLMTIAGDVERAVGCPMPFGTSIVAVATKV